SYLASSGSTTSESSSKSLTPAAVSSNEPSASSQELEDMTTSEATAYPTNRPLPKHFSFLGHYYSTTNNCLKVP
ncbi:hypothetical protein BG000_004313, partial [Podila horticola]